MTYFHRSKLNFV